MTLSLRKEMFDVLFSKFPPEANKTDQPRAKKDHGGGFGDRCRGSNTIIRSDASATLNQNII